MSDLLNVVLYQGRRHISQCLWNNQHRPELLYFARVELRRAGDVSPLILRQAHNQEIDIPRLPKAELRFHREQNPDTDPRTVSPAVVATSLRSAAGSASAREVAA